MLMLQEKGFREGTGKKSGYTIKGYLYLVGNQHTHTHTHKNIQSLGYPRNIEENTKASVEKAVVKVIYQTEKWVEKTRHSRVFFNQLRSVWICDETIFPVFDIASQSINNS